MIEPRADRPQAITLAADKAYDAEDFINELPAMRVTPRMWRRTPAGARRRLTAARRDTPATLSVSASASGSKKPSGWIKTIAGQEKTKFRGRARRMGLHLRGRGLQSGAAAQAHCGADMSAPANCKLVGCWRIVKADIWDRDHLDLCGPAMITITDHGRGEITFGALQAGLDIEYSRSSIGFTWEGFDEMDEVSGDGSAELLDDGSIEIEFAYHNGDEAVLKAKRETSSTAC